MATNLVNTFKKLISVKLIKKTDFVELFKTKILRNKSLESDLKKLAQALEGILLAIMYAIAYIRSRPRVTVSVYLCLFWESKVN